MYLTPPGLMHTHIHVCIPTKVCLFKCAHMYPLSINVNIHEDTLAFTCCMPVYLFILHVCLHITYMCTSTHLHHVCTYIPLYALQYTCVFTQAYTCVCVSAPVSTGQRHVCTHIYACASTCICLCSHTVYAHDHA